MDIMFKLGYFTKEFDPATMRTWVSFKASGEYKGRQDVEHVEAEKEALAKLTDMMTEALDMYITAELEQLQLRFDRRQRMQAGDR